MNGIKYDAGKFDQKIAVIYNFKYARQSNLNEKSYNIKANVYLN